MWGSKSFLQSYSHLFVTIGVPIGIVTAIAAPASIKVEFEGNGGHAGAVLMPARLAFPSIFWRCN